MVQEIKFLLPLDTAEKALAWARENLEPDCHGQGQCADEYFVQNKLLYNLPSTYGADNDARPTNGEAFWWRSGGYISRPVLANPHFPALYLSRVREILETEFTEAKLFPLIDQYGERLKAEVELRAAAAKQDSSHARQEFENNIGSLKEFVTKRRQWLLGQAEIRDSGSPAGK